RTGDAGPDRDGMGVAVFVDVVPGVFPSTGADRATERVAAKRSISHFDCEVLRIDPGVRGGTSGSVPDARVRLVCAEDEPPWPARARNTLAACLALDRCYQFRPLPRHAPPGQHQICPRHSLRDLFIRCRFDARAATAPADAVAEYHGGYPRPSDINI